MTWYVAKEDLRRFDPEGPYTPRNVTGRFEDHAVIDGPASRTARKSVYKRAIILFEKAERNADGGVSLDISPKTLRFDAYPEEAQEAIRRFPEAWHDYLLRRTVPVQTGEQEVIENIYGHIPTEFQAFVARLTPKEHATTQRKRGRPRKQS